MKIASNRLLPQRFPYESLIVLAILTITALFYYRNIFSYWFIIDDPAAMLYSMNTSQDVFLSNKYSYAFYTPLVALSFKPDVMLFGLNPIPYHIHNTLILILIAFMAYRILRLYTDGMSSFVPPIIILFSTPSLVCITWIVLRQYLYPMLFSLLSIYLFLKYKPDLKNNKFTVLIILSLSELSFIGKEQYMTIPFVLFILSDGGFKERISKTYPYFILLTAHFFLRMYVLGGLGGYIGGNYLNYSLAIFGKTIFKSIFTTSKIIFGYDWFVILSVIPFLLKPKKIILWLLLWIASLLISFFAMSSYPYADTYRYWFIAAVIFSFMIGLAVNTIRKRTVKIACLSAVLVFFCFNTFNINKNTKMIFHEKSLVSESVSRAMVDNKYLNDIIIFPDDIFLIASQYVEHMAAVYHTLYKVKFYPTFLPREFIVFYPQIVKEYEKIHEVRMNSVIDITDSIDEKMKPLKDILIDEHPETEIKITNNKVELNLKCKSGKAIIAYLISWKYGRLFYGETIGPYLERIDLIPFFKDSNIDIISREDIKYYNKEWYIGSEPLKDNEKLVTLSCFTEDNKITQLSDMLYIRKQDMSKK